MSLLARMRPRRLTAVAAAAVATVSLVGTFPPPVSAQSADDCVGNCVFVLERGRFEGIEVPFRDNHQDFVRFNNRGDIVGAYVPDESVNALVAYRGYVRDRGGRVTLVDVPGAIATFPYDINDGGAIVGASADTPSGEREGFLRDRHGRYRTVRPPAADHSQAFGIDDHGRVVGEYRDAGGTFHGYLWTGGRVVDLDVPGAAHTAATDLNDRGEIVGLWADAAGRPHGFVRDRDGRYRTFEVPFGQEQALPPAINNRGQIVGSAFTVSPDGRLTEAHGYLLPDGVGGPVVRIDYPGTDLSGAFAISDSGAILGLYGPPGPLPEIAEAMPAPLADARPGGPG